jgi:hypothetical protein
MELTISGANITYSLLTNPANFTVIYSQFSNNTLVVTAYNATGPLANTSVVVFDIGACFLIQAKTFLYFLYLQK